MIVVDSSVWIENLRDQSSDATRRLRLIDENDILVGDVVLLEVLRGARTPTEAHRLERYLLAFECVRMMDEIAALRAASNYRLLRSRGITIRNTIDLIIGTYCIEHGHALLQNDRDFQPMAEHLGLRLI